MKPTSNNIAGVILAGLWLTSATVVRAATTATLDFLQGTPGSELTIGNLVFYNFSLPAQTPFTVDLSHITVEAYQDAGTLDYGIRFDSADWHISGASASYDMTFGFNVRTDDGRALIEDDTLLITGSSNAGYFRVIEDITNTDGLLAHGDAYVDLPGSGTHNADHMTFAPQSDISINKDFSMGTFTDPGGQETVSEISQIFSQVPESGSSTLLMLGGLGLLARRQRA